MSWSLTTAQMGEEDQRSALPEICNRKIDDEISNIDLLSQLVSTLDEVPRSKLRPVTVNPYFMG